MSLRNNLTNGEVFEKLDWLASENAKGHHIYIRPSGLSQLTLIDDLTRNSLKRLIDTGYTPACVVETSQATFRLGSSTLGLSPPRKARSPPRSSRNDSAAIRIQPTGGTLAALPALPTQSLNTASPMGSFPTRTQVRSFQRRYLPQNA